MRCNSPRWRSNGMHVCASCWGTVLSFSGRAWRRIADALPRPRAIVMLSAHCSAPVTLVGAATRLEAIHDFFGFPAPLYEIEYPASGAPDLALSLCAHLPAQMWPARSGSLNACSATGAAFARPEPQVSRLCSGFLATPARLIWLRTNSSNSDPDRSPAGSAASISGLNVFEHAGLLMGGYVVKAAEEQWSLVSTRTRRTYFSGDQAVIKRLSSARSQALPASAW